MTDSAEDARQLVSGGRGNVEDAAPSHEAAVVPTETQVASRSPSAGSHSRVSVASSRSHQSVHVQIPPGVQPGEKFFVVVDDMEYEVWAPDDAAAGEMVAMDVYRDEAESQKALTASRDSGRRSQTKTSEPESVASNGSLVYVQVPDGCQPGETFFTEVNGFEYEILVPSTCQSGDLIYLEVPAKSAMSKFIVPENSQASLPYDAPSLMTDQLADTEGDGHLADIRVPPGVAAGQTFVVIIDGVEFEVPVPEGYGPGDLMSLQLPNVGVQPAHQASLTATGLDEVRAELEQVRAELQEVRQSHQREVTLREAALREAREAAEAAAAAAAAEAASQQMQQMQMQRQHEDDRFLHQSKSSGDSSFIQIQIPMDCYEGDAFVVEVDDNEFRMVVPAGCSPGEVIYMDMREGLQGAGYQSQDLTTQQRNGSRPASGVRKIAKDIVPEETASHTESLRARSSISDTAGGTLEIEIPEDCYPGDIFLIEVNGAELELTVPDGCQPGELIYVDLPRDGSSAVTSRPHSANQRPREAEAEQQETASSSLSQEAAMEIIIPEDCYPGDIMMIEVNGAELELTVPEGCQPGELIYVDLPRDGSSVVTSRPASAEQKRQYAAKLQEDERAEAEEEQRRAQVAQAQRERLDSKKQLAAEKAEREAREEETRIKKEEAMSVFSGQVEALLADAVGETYQKSGREEVLPAKPQEADRADQTVAAKPPAEQAAAEAASQPAVVAAESVPQLAVVPVADEAPEAEGREVKVSRSPSVISGRSRRSTYSNGSSYSIHVQIPVGVYAGDRFLVMVDDKEYEVVAPEGSAPGEMVAMDIQSDAGESHVVLMVSSKESQAASKDVADEKVKPQVVAKPREVAAPAPAAPAPAAPAPAAPAPAAPATASEAASDGDSVAADAILVPVEIPDGCSEGETFFAEVNGVEYEILVPQSCKAGHLIYLEVPAKHAIGKFVAPESAEPTPEIEVPQVSLKDAATVQSGGPDNLFAEVCVPEGAREGENFVAVIDGTEFEVPVPEGFRPGDTLSLQLPSNGIEADLSSTALQEVWAELAKVREELKEVQDDQLRYRQEQRLTYSSDSEESNLVEIVVPEDCFAGDAFIVEVDEAEYEMVVPDGCGAGEIIYMDMQGAILEDISSDQKRLSRSASSVRKAHQEPKHEVVEIVIPEECQAGDVFLVEVKGQQLEMTVPDGCHAGDAILMDLLPGGSLVLSRPSSAKVKSIEDAAQTESAKREGAAPETVQESSVEAGEAGPVVEQPEAIVAEAEAAPAKTEEVVREGEAYRLVVSILAASGLIAEANTSCACRIKGKEDAEFETSSMTERVNPEWNHEHLLEDYKQGQILEFELSETLGESRFGLGSVQLLWDQFHEGFNESVSLTGTEGQLHIKIENLGSVAEHVAQLEAERLEAERLEAERLEEERLVAEQLAKLAEMARMEAQERERMQEEEERSKMVEAAIAEEEAERRRQEEERQREIEEAERLRREEEEREAAKEAAKKAKEEAERQRLELLKQQALEEAERAVREEEARIKREEAERKGKIVISVTVLNDETEEMMAKASLRLGCKVAELGQVCIREARLSVAPAIFAEPKAEAKMVRGKMELRERYPLPPEDTLLECGVENNAVLRAKISSAVITASKDCTARIWNAETGNCQLVLEGHNEAVCSACISPDCRYVATSSEDSSARLWYVDSGRCARVLQDHKEAVYSASFSPDSKQVVTASEDGTAKIWVVKTGLCKLTLKGHNFAVLWAAFSPDGRSVTTTSSDGTLKIWNAKTGVCDRTLLGQKPVYLASFATDGTTFVTASGDDTAKICDLMTGESKIVLSGHESLVLGASYAPSCPQAEPQAEQQAENG